MCASSSVEALSFLRKSVGSVVPKEDMTQFNSLAMRLFDEQGIYKIEKIEKIEKG